MGIIIGEKNPRLVKSEDVGNLARMNYGKPVTETAVGEEELTSVGNDGTAEEATSEPNEQETDNSANGEKEAVVGTKSTKGTKSKKGGRPKKS